MTQVPCGCRRLAPTSGLARCTAAVAWATAGLVACSANLDWRQLQPPGWALALAMPCKPSTQVRQLPLAGTTVALTLLACTEQGHTFAVASADMGDPGRVAPALQALALAAVSNVQGRVVQDAPAAVAGMTPNPLARLQRLIGRLPDGTAVELRVLLFAHGGRVFQATLIGPRADDALAQPFFEGVRVLP